MYGKKPVPVLDTGPQRNRPYKQLIYTACNYAIPCQARERDSCNTTSSLYSRQYSGLSIASAHFTFPSGISLASEVRD